MLLSLVSLMYMRPLFSCPRNSHRLRSQESLVQALATCLPMPSSMRTAGCVLCAHVCRLPCLSPQFIAEKALCMLSGVFLSCQLALEVLHHSPVHLAVFHRRDSSVPTRETFLLVWVCAGGVALLSHSSGLRSSPRELSPYSLESSPRAILRLRRCLTFSSLRLALRRRLVVAWRSCSRVVSPRGCGGGGGGGMGSAMTVVTLVGPIW
jgi:hypothetical protein